MSSSRTKITVSSLTFAATHYLASALGAYAEIYVLGQYDPKFTPDDALSFSLTVLALVWTPVATAVFTAALLVWRGRLAKVTTARLTALAAAAGLLSAAAPWAAFNVGPLISS